MKKTLRVSLIAACALASVQTYSLAADNISQAFAEGKVKGQVKSYYFSKSYDSTTKKDGSILVSGMQLGYKTGSLHGFSLGATSQFATVNSIDDDSSVYSGTMDNSGTVTSEMYLQYDIDKTTAKAGRQFFWTPVVGGSGSRFIRQSFSGYTLTNASFENTKIVAAYLTRFAERTDKNGGPGDFTAESSRVGIDGTMTAYVKNSSVENLTLQAQYASKSESTQNAKDGHDILYVDGTYKFKNDMKPFIAAQYLSTDYEASNSESSSAMGLKVGATISGVNAYVAYTSVDKDNNVKQGIGSGSIPLYTNGHQVDAWSATLADTTAYKIGLGYKMDTLSLGFAHSSYDKEGKDKVSETGVTVANKFSKQLMLQLQYATVKNQYVAEADIEKDLRTRLIYSF